MRQDRSYSRSAFLDLPRQSARILQLSRLTLLAAILVTLAVVAHVGPARAASPPATPVTGLCDVTVPSGSIIVSQGTVKYPDGSIHTSSHDDCVTNHPTMVLPQINDWSTYGISRDGNGVGTLNAYWNVPNAPSNYGGTTPPVNFLFNGIQPDGAAWIVQPVLGYGCTNWVFFGSCVSPGIGGGFWWISAYYVVGNQGTNTGALQVNPGDQIAGVLAFSTNCNGTGTTGYYIGVNDNTIGKGSVLCYSTSSAAPNAYLTLEDKRVDYCNQLPNQSSITFYTVTSTSSLTWSSSGQTGQTPQCSFGAGIAPTNVHIHSYPTTDTYSRSHGLAKDRALPNPWWPPYQSGYEFQVTGSAFDYYETDNFVWGSHYLQEAASGFVPSYAWHTQIYINSVLTAQGDVGRANPLQANFNVNSYNLYWSPS